MSGKRGLVYLSLAVMTACGVVAAYGMAYGPVPAAAPLTLRSMDLLGLCLALTAALSGLGEVRRGTWRVRGLKERPRLGRVLTGLTVAAAVCAALGLVLGSVGCGVLLGVLAALALACSGAGERLDRVLLWRHLPCRAAVLGVLAAAWWGIPHRFGAVADRVSVCLLSAEVMGLVLTALGRKEGPRC